jgi:hypothetical protein
LPDVGKAAPVTPPALRAEKKWTVMVFINGKNDLEMAGLYNVNQMERVGSTKDVNIVVEIGRMNGQDDGDTDADGNWTGSRRLFIKKDKDESRITSPGIEGGGNADMGDYRRVVSFINWARKNYPARKYMLILWDHGTGWLDPRQTATAAGKGIAFDDETNNYIRTRQIGQVLKEAGKVDVLAFDACLMQMGEVAFEVKDKTDVIVGSEEVVPGLGYPYSLFLGALAKNPNMSAESLGVAMVESFKMFYDAVKKSAQLSAIRSSKLEEFGTKTAEFAALAREVNDVAALNAARAGVLRYEILGKASDPKKTISFYGDLHDYAGLLAANLKGAEGPTNAALLKVRSAELQEFIDKQLVIANKASGKDRLGRELSDSHGISVYLPPAEAGLPQAKLESVFEGKYTEFEFDKAVKWHDFVTYLYGVKAEAPDDAADMPPAPVRGAARSN